MSKTKINDPGAHHAGSGALIRRFLPYLAKYKKTLFLDLFCAALTTLCDIVLPKIMSTITNAAMGVGITLTAGIVLRLAALYFVLRIIDGAASYYMSSIGHIMGVHIETDMRRDAFDHLLRLDHTYYNNTKVGTIMGRITNDLFDVTEFAHHCPEEFFIAAIKIVVSFVILCQASIPLTLAVFACVPLMGIVSVKLNQRLRARFRQQRIQIGELNATIEDSLLGQGVVKAFAAEEQERAKFEQGNKDFEHIKTLGYYAMAAFNTSTRLFDGLMYLVVILAGGLSLVYGRITAGDMVAYMLYVTTLIATIRRIVEFAEQFQRGMTGIERFAEIMDTPVPIHDAPDARPLQPGPGAHQGGQHGKGGAGSAWDGQAGANGQVDQDHKDLGKHRVDPACQLFQTLGPGHSHHSGNGQPHGTDGQAQKGRPEMGACLGPQVRRKDQVASPEKHGKQREADEQQLSAR